MVDMQVSGRFKYWTLLLQQTNQENSDLSKREGGMESGWGVGLCKRGAAGKSEGGWREMSKRGRSKRQDEYPFSFGGQPKPQDSGRRFLFAVQAFLLLCAWCGFLLKACFRIYWPPLFG
ncbi:hypothetical protein CEXT_337081 [Caerostris extrusa]|uniref:Uncharacterized protein n=1 Tax=Caerostris extrusa TaxID=172846 RepID=A0AAV4MQD5_CAEEX|nr:hypothetical protein CEXT_337081 [Caerostris extrusa]